MPIVNRVADLHDEITAWRHDLHAHPELLFDVHRTAASVADKLKAFGCDEVVTGIGRTGVVGVIRGAKGGKAARSSACAPTWMRCRSTRQTTCPTSRRSRARCTPAATTATPPCCSGAANYLAETRNFAGTAVVIFQPAEEGGGGGREMVKDGMMERFGIEEVYGMHNFPGIPLGEFAIRPGPIMAAADRIYIDIEGRAVHAARPHQSVDTHPGRGADHQPAPVDRVAQRRSAGVGGGVDLSIPRRHRRQRHPADRAAAGTARSLSPEVRDLLEARVREVVEGTAKLYGAKATLTYKRDYPVTLNHERQTDFAADVAARGGRRASVSTTTAAGDGRGGFLLHAQCAAGRLHLRRQRRQRRAASPGLQLQR